MGLQRRTFLRQMGMTLAALGISEAGLSLLTQNYGAVLAQPTRRKLALLVGINQYPESVCDYPPLRGAALLGCLTDVELQRELLIHRFGFLPSDIITLTDQQATRSAIADTFLSHLTEQAQAGDVVVVHFSGLGSQVAVPQVTGDLLVQRSLVPIDGRLPTATDAELHDLMSDTLNLLLRSLATNQVTTILDQGCTQVGHILQGNLRIRARPNAPTGQIDANEQRLQQQLRQQAKHLQTPGLVLAAATEQTLALEGPWSGFSAGLLTYALTQQLWCTTAATTVSISLAQAADRVSQWTGREQQPNVSPTLETRAQPMGSPPQHPSRDRPSGVWSDAGAEGVIQAIADGKVTVWLAGLPALVLDHAGASWFEVIDAMPSGQPAQGMSAPLVQLRSRDGLLGKARLLDPDSPVQIGQWVQERVRVLPRQIGLTVALDSSLERIERVDATSAFATIPQVSAIMAGEQSADVLFGKTQNRSTVAALPPLSAPIPSKPSYGLFSPSRSALVPVSPGDEAIKTAVQRMTDPLKTLLAVKLLRLTENHSSSRLRVRAGVESLETPSRSLTQTRTQRGPGTMSNLVVSGDRPMGLSSDRRIQYRLTNDGDRSVHAILVDIFSKEDQGVALNVHNAVPVMLPSQETIVTPQQSDWMSLGQSDCLETYAIFSLNPFTETSKILSTKPFTTSDRRLSIDHPLVLAKAILNDLHCPAVALGDLPTDLPTDSYALDVTSWATLSLTYSY